MKKKNKYYCDCILCFPINKKNRYSKEFRALHKEELKKLVKDQIASEETRGFIIDERC